MAKVWTYDEMTTGVAQASDIYNVEADFYYHPTFGEMPVPTPQDVYNAQNFIGVTKQDIDTLYSPYLHSKVEFSSLGTPERQLTEQEMYEFLLDNPYYTRGGTPPPEEIERARQQRILQRGATRKRTRIASLAEGQTGGAARTMLAAAKEPQDILGTGGTMLSGIL